MLSLPAREPARPVPSQDTGVGLRAGLAIPVRAFPAAHLLEICADCGETLMERGSTHVACGRQRHSGVVALVNHTEGFDGTLTTVFGIRLVGVEAIDIDRRDVNIGMARDNPVSQHATQTAARQN